MAETPAPQPASDVAAGAAAESLSVEADSTALQVRKKEQEDDAIATCKRKISEIERRKHDDKDYVSQPEEELEIGKCYQTLQQVTEARKWLRRAAAHPETKARAEKALGELAPE
jgi:lipopolysaccharide biosynthesis regulator YciM